MLKRLGKISFILIAAEKRKLIILFLGTLFVALLETFSIGIIVPSMNSFINSSKIQDARMFQWFCELTRIQNPTVFITFLIAGMIILFVFKSLYILFMLYWQSKVVTGIYVRVTNEILNSYLNKSYAFHLENNSSILFRNVYTIVRQFSFSFLYPLVLLCSNAIILLAIFGLIFYKYPLATLLLGGVFSIGLTFINFFIRKRIKLYALQRKDAEEKAHKSALEALQGVKEIMVCNAQDFFKKRYSRATGKYADTDIKFNFASNAPHYLLEIILITSLFMALLIGMYFYKDFSALIPTIVTLGYASLRILTFLSGTYRSFNIFRYYSNSFDIVYEILKGDTQKMFLQETLPAGVNVFRQPENILLKNLEFRYNKAAASIFKNFNLVIPKHKTVAFAGETGAGKSTLVDILMGLLIPTNGVLCYDRIPITPQNVSEYRRRIGYVPQQIFLIDDTLEANIAFGVAEDKVDDKQLKNVIRISQLESLVNELPEGIKTRIGEKGVRLSGGQRQRVAIARALYNNPEILILDEATSALDGYTEAEIGRAIKTLSGKLTIIIIAHRLTTIEYADIIYLMDHGKIVDQGRFEELLANSPTFQKIANKIPT